MEPRIRASAVFLRSKVLQNPKTGEALTMYRTLSLVDVPYTLPLRTPKDRVMILRDTMLSKMPSFTASKKLTGEDTDPLMPDEDGERDSEMPRDAEASNC